MQITSSITSDSGLTVRQSTEKPEIIKADIRPITESSEQKRDRSERLGELQKSLEEHGITLKFSQNSKTNQLVVQMVDVKTGETVRQLPSEVSVKLAELYNGLQGQIVDEHF